MGPPPVHHATTYEDDRRARELFHYFQPDNPALLPAGPRDAGLTNPSLSSRKASPNLVLTALTQLAAIKLGVQRAIIRYIVRSEQALPSVSTVHMKIFSKENIRRHVRSAATNMT